ncbi:hypothetical protein F5B22DRAFT_457186 [Xylaria bambusicola]|uniref:uncharacterized protein n=1 Tax=Xylaria bambusicola TaxID=326684 RepID=UPI002008B39B|nr:uncharacterized protein F5B22DRAFT_457186 [Xylaria bambusicola]KAI0522054.1 hypothetical protein F5B22DRAFT_457186 [Xylaria bambusicola]
MAAIPRRQKACIPCAESKRRCDKQLPACRRCIEKDLDCAYPQPRKRRRDPGTAHETQAIPTSGHTESLVLPEQTSFSGTAGSDATSGVHPDLGHWDLISANNLEAAFLDEAITPPQITSTAPTPILIPDQALSIHDSNNFLRKSSTPFFLQDDTFRMHHKQHDPDCVTTVEMEPFIGEVEKMLQSWVTNGSSNFIHRRLYDKGMPTCVQDAFTTFAAYANRTPATKETILQIADDRATTLTQHTVNPAVNGIQEIWAHLARVHSLFVYVFIRLFDGSVRMRASAAQQIPTLRSWLGQMWETVKRHNWDDYPSIRDAYRPLLGTSSEFHSDYDTATEIWQLWILTESVRRTYLIIDITLNTFEIMTVGRADCEGYVLFTARCGLWDANSAVKWFNLCRGDARSPLMVPSLTPQPVISQYLSTEFDEFAKLCWSFVVGTDKIQSWVDRMQ